jgi:hypothetical protein
MKRLLKHVPVIDYLPVPFRKSRDQFSSSSEDWDMRYRTGRNSGPGSCNRLAEFKASFLNTFVEQHRIGSVIEFGCDGGAQLKLAQYKDYTGVDSSLRAVEMCQNLFSGDASKRFLQSDAVMPDVMTDLSLSLDVVYHLVGGDVFESYMERLFRSARNSVIAYSSNMDQDSPAKHGCHRQFARWVEQTRPDWCVNSTHQGCVHLRLLQSRTDVSR